MNYEMFAEFVQTDNASLAQKRPLTLELEIKREEARQNKENVKYARLKIRLTLSFVERDEYMNWIINIRSRSTQKEHAEFFKILKFCVNFANIEQDTAI